jgi:two-component system cell cycle response regulator DivK
MSKVLIFDDDRDILELCSVILQKKGHEPVIETNSKNVISRINETAPDVILMDIWIPGIGGEEAIQLIKDNPSTKHIPVILFSANNNIEIIAKEANADYYLKKPFDIATLNNIISKALSPDDQGS